MSSAYARLIPFETTLNLTDAAKEKLPLQTIYFLAPASWDDGLIRPQFIVNLSEATPRGAIGHPRLLCWSD